MTDLLAGCGKKMKIRKATFKDLTQLVKLDREANIENKWWMPLRREDFVNFLKKGDSLFVAEDNGEVIGYQSTKIKDKILTLEDLYVKMEFRNKGIASKLIKIAISIGKKKNALRIRLDCPERLRKFYEKFGFKVTALIMQKKAK